MNATDALDGFEARTAAETNHLACAKQLLASPDGWDRSTPIHLTASALVVDPSTQRLLLRWHERLGRWAQVGGHAEDDEVDPLAIAFREASEETGLRDLAP